MSELCPAAATDFFLLPSCTENLDLIPGSPAESRLKPGNSSAKHRQPVAVSYIHPITLTLLLKIQCCEIVLRIFINVCMTTYSEDMVDTQIHVLNSAPNSLGHGAKDDSSNILA